MKSKKDGGVGNNDRKKDSKQLQRPNIIQSLRCTK
jgi:hypothetical protein